MTPVLHSATQFHAHKCIACEAKGVETVWIHPDTCIGNVQAHTCPQCGAIQWKQCKVESGKLPQVPARQQGGVNAEIILGWAMLVVVAALLGYVAFLAIEKYRSKKVAE